MPHYPPPGLPPKMETYDAGTMMVYCGDTRNHGRPGPTHAEMAGMIREGDIFLTDDAEVKQTAWVGLAVAHYDDLYG